MTCLSGIDHITFSSRDIQDQKAIVSTYIQVNPIKSTYFWTYELQDMLESYLVLWNAVSNTFNLLKAKLS